MVPVWNRMREVSDTAAIVGSMLILNIIMVCVYTYKVSASACLLLEAGTNIC